MEGFSVVEEAGLTTALDQFAKFVGRLVILQLIVISGLTTAIWEHLLSQAKTIKTHDPAWYANSGASSHATNDAGNLNQKQPYDGNESLIVGNGTTLNILHIGQTTLPALNNRTLLLKDILHVPSIEKNLISVSQWTVYNDIFVNFDSFGCVVMDKVTG